MAMCHLSDKGCGGGVGSCGHWLPHRKKETNKQTKTCQTQQLQSSTDPVKTAAVEQTQLYSQGGESHLQNDREALRKFHIWPIPLPIVAATVQFPPSSQRRVRPCLKSTAYNCCDRRPGTQKVLLLVGTGSSYRPTRQLNEG